MAIDKYLDNITSEHRDKPKFISWLSKNLEIIDGAYLLMKEMDSNFDLDNAIGVQLDKLGTIIGRSRILSFQPVNGYSPILDDEMYRLVLKTKIAMNNWGGTVPEMYDIWDNIFGQDDDLDLQLEDNQDMSFNAYITGYVDPIQQELIQHQYIIPKPEGVRVNYIGRSKIPFDVYSAIVVSVCQTEVINMDFDQSEKIDLGGYSRITVQQIKTETINLDNKSNHFDYLVDQDGKLLIDQEGKYLVERKV